MPCSTVAKIPIFVSFMLFLISFKDAVFEEIAISIGVKKGSSLKDEINEALSTISEETRNKIMDKAVKNQLAINN